MPTLPPDPPVVMSGEELRYRSRHLKRTRDAASYMMRAAKRSLHAYLSENPRKRFLVVVGSWIGADWVIAAGDGCCKVRLPQDCKSTVEQVICAMSDLYVMHGYKAIAAYDDGSDGCQPPVYSVEVRL